MKKNPYSGNINLIWCPQDRQIACLTWTALGYWFHHIIFCLLFPPIRKLDDVSVGGMKSQLDDTNTVISRAAPKWPQAILSSCYICLRATYMLCHLTVWTTFFKRREKLLLYTCLPGCSLSTLAFEDTVSWSRDTVQPMRRCACVYRDTTTTFTVASR